MTASLSRIPMRPAKRWQDFCQRFLPLIVFGSGILTAAAIWSRAIAPPTLVAEAERIAIPVAAPHAGTLADLRVGELQPVAAGTVIGHLLPADPRVAAASIAVIRAEVENLRASLSPAISLQRATVDYRQLQLDVMRERVNLAALKAQLIEAESNVARLTRLYGQRAASEESYTSAINLRDGLASQVDEQTRLVAQIEPSLETLDAPIAGTPGHSADDTLAAAVRVQEEKLRLVEAGLGPIELIAPIDGVVAIVAHRAGESILAGEPIVSVAATRPARLVGFMRQPLALEPQVGMRVEVRTRTYSHAAATATIEQVGATMEPISPTLLAAVNRQGAPDQGLRLHITIPETLDLRPGEQVDITIRE